MRVVKIRQRCNMLSVSSVKTSKVKDDDPVFEYEKNGGDQTWAW